MIEQRTMGNIVCTVISVAAVVMVVGNPIAALSLAVLARGLCEVETY